MGQQMGKEAEPPLICSTENTVWPHPGRKREESSTAQKNTAKKTEGKKYKRRTRDSYVILSQQSYLLLPPTEQPRGARGLWAI